MATEKVESEIGPAYGFEACSLEQVVNDLGSIMEAMKSQHAELQEAILQLLPEVSSLLQLCLPVLQPFSKSKGKGDCQSFM